MNLLYQSQKDIREISTFKLIEKDTIMVDAIPETENIFLSLGEEYYIFDTKKFSLTKLPFNLEIIYIK